MSRTRKIKQLPALFLSLFSAVTYAEVSTGSVPVTSPVIPPAVLSAKDANAEWLLYAEQWELARSGDTVMSLPVLKQVIQVWLSDKQKKLEIQYPGGEDGEFWVQELSDWLVSLGIPSQTMVITPGSGADDVIKFNIVK